MSQGFYPLDQSEPAVPKAPTSKCFREISVFPLVVIRSPKALTFPDRLEGSPILNLKVPTFTETPGL